MSKLVRIALVVALVLGIGAAGLALGSNEAPNAGDAESAEKAAYRLALKDAAVEAHEESVPHGREAGLQVGERRGADVGHADGQRAGHTAVERRLDAIAEQEAQAAAEAAAAEATERAANCGAPLFTEGYCPTDEEIELENNAESLCGPGTPEGRAEAAELGIQC
jgi:hypothetical protein